MSLKSGFVGLVGTPNAGKSSFLNRILKEKVSIVTPKPQTTRRRVVGIVPFEENQVVFVDAPGAVKSSSGLNPFLKEELHNVIQSSDALLAVLGLDENSPENIDEILSMVSTAHKPWAAFINKTDLADKNHRLSIVIAKVEALGGKYFSGTCTTNDGIPKNEILSYFVDKLPESGAPLFNPELFTTSSVRDLCAEIVREKCFEFLHQEIPYSLAVHVMRFDETGKIPRITFEIYVAKETHKALVIGKKGERLKEIAIAARKEIELLLDTQVFIEFHVSFKEDWMKNKKIMEELGYVVTVE